MRVERRSLAGLKYLELSPGEAGSGTPVIVGLHGRGASADDLAGWLPTLDPARYRYVLPNGPLRVDLGPWGLGHAWYGVDGTKHEDIPRSRELLFAFLEAVGQRYQVPRSRICLLGFSQGAVLTLEVGLRLKPPLAALVPLSGYLYEGPDLESVLSRAVPPPIFLAHGRHDEVLSVDMGRKARALLERSGLGCEYFEFEGGHQVTGQELMQVRLFLARALEIGSS